MAESGEGHGRKVMGYLPINLVEAVVAFATVATLTRMLSPEDFGHYALAMALAQIVQGAAFYWIHGGIVRLWAEAQTAGRAAHLVQSSLAAFCASAVAAAVLVYAALSLIPHSAALDRSLLIAIPIFLTRSLSLIGFEIARTSQQVRRFSLLSGSQTVLTFTLAVLILFTTSWGKEGVLWAAVLAAFAVFLADMPRLIGLGKGGRPDGQMLRAMWVYGGPFIPTTLMSLTLQISDRFLIETFLDARAVGIYAAAYQIADRVLSILFTWPNQAAVPLMYAALEKDGVAAAEQVMRRNLDVVLFLTMPAAVGIALVAAPLSALIVGPDFAPAAATITPWIAAGAWVCGFSVHMLAHPFLLSKRTGLLALTLLGPALVNIAANILLLPRTGVVGAAYSTVLAYALLAVIRIFTGRRLFPLPLPPLSFLKTGAACAVMAAAVLAAGSAGDDPFMLLRLVPAGILAYGLAALALDLAGCRGTALSLAARVAARLAARRAAR